MKTTKKAMKRLTALVALTLTALLLLPFAASAKEKDLWVDMDYEELWERKNEAEGEVESTGIQEGFYPSSPFLGNKLTVLFYTDAFDDLTFERLPDEAYEEEPVYYIPGELEELYLLGLYSEELQDILIKKCLYVTEVKSEEDTYFTYEQHLPYLRACIEAFDISKEELRAACELSRETPDFIKDKLLAYHSAATIESMEERGALSCNYDQSYLLDALYLPDENDVRELCLLPYGVWVNDRVLCAYELELNLEKHGTKEQQDAWQAILDANINTVGMKRFLQNANAVADHYDWIEGQPFRKNIAALEVRVAELDALEETPPKAGDDTAVYLIVSELGFGIGVVALRFLKRKKQVEETVQK